MRLTFSSGPAVLATRTSGQEAIREAITAGFAGFRAATGGYRIETEWRYVVGIA